MNEKLVNKNNAMIGGRVVRGPDWIYSDTQDGNGPGTITSISSESLDEESRWVKVIWDKTTHENGYRIGPIYHDLEYIEVPEKIKLKIKIPNYGHEIH